MNRLILQTLLLIVTTTALSWFIVSEMWHGLLLAPFIFYQCHLIIQVNKRLLSEIQELVATVRYRDFSRKFYNRRCPSYIRQIHNGFNEICDVIKAINLEKEMQYQYLQKIIEMVDTGILSYRIDTGEVLWMNRALKDLLEIPTLKYFNSLHMRNALLFESLQALDQEFSTVITVTKEHSRSKVLVAASTFIMQDTHYRLMAFQNVNEALDEAESQAWQQLLNVMTHEIMNSVAPISSLAGTLKNLIEKTKTQKVSPENVVEDIELGIDAIMRRSRGLLAFAETYRNLGKITELNVSKVQVRNLFEHISQLMLPSLTHKNIELEIILKDPLMRIDADASLVEQIMINLILNAIEAVKESDEPRITLSAGMSAQNRPFIKVIDNGIGISDELVERIFVPFFSTRKNGSGIGLSLCKQIMLMHRGNIQVHSTESGGSTFSLLF